MNPSRPRSQVNQLMPEMAETAPASTINGNEDLRFSAKSVVMAGHSPRKRSGHQQLLELIDRLSERDLGILSSLKLARYLVTHQIQRLHFTDSATQATAIRATAKTMRRLKSHDLVRHFPRPIGGVRAGSGSYIWYLTEAGQRLLVIRNKEELPRRSHRYLEPSYIHIKHTLATAECYVQLTEISRKHRKVQLQSLEWEPDCWRPYKKDSFEQVLKPDLFAATVNDGYEDRWFIEIDLDTEALPVVIDKCKRYYFYFKTGAEQKQHKVFPVTVWIVPDEKRKLNMQTAINETFGPAAKLFTVITADEFEHLIVCGAG